MEALTSMIEERTDYNGWTNYETWNVALWLQNDEAMYTVAKHYSTFDALIPRLEYRFGQMTPDGVCVGWMDASTPMNWTRCSRISDPCYNFTNDTTTR